MASRRVGTVAQVTTLDLTPVQARILADGGAVAARDGQGRWIGLYVDGAPPGALGLAVFRVRLSAAEVAALRDAAQGLTVTADGAGGGWNLRVGS